MAHSYHVLIEKTFCERSPISSKISFVLFVKLKWDKLFNSFLQPSGQFFNPSNVVLKKCKSCPTSNVSVERLIGQLDKKITDVFLTYKVHVLYNDNKTGNQ